MPAANQVVDWPFDPDGPKVRTRKQGTPHGRLVTYMENRAPGRISLKEIARELDLNTNAKKDLQKNLRNENHPTTLALKAMGVTYAVTGKAGAERVNS
jgi:predicted transcriptional regulator